MTISAVVPDIAFTGSGGAGTMGPFSLVKSGTPLVFFANSEVVVLRYDSVTDTTPTLLVEGTDYTLTGGPTAGSITLTSPQTGLLTAERLYVTTVSALAQSLDLVNGGNFSSSNLERRLDVIFQILQQHAREIKSTIRFAMFDTDNIPGTVPIGAALNKIPYITGTASNPSIAFIEDADTWGDLSQFTVLALADIAIVAADLSGADTIGIVAAAIDDVEDVAASIIDVNTVADALNDGSLFIATYADTYAAARLLTGLTVGNSVRVRGRTATRDGGEGWFTVAAGGTDRDGLVLVMADGKALIRDDIQERVDLDIFGIVPGTVTVADFNTMVTSMSFQTTRAVTARGGVYVFGSRPANITTILRIEGAGESLTTLERGYSEGGGDTVGFLEWRDAGANNSKLSSMLVRAGSGTTGGTMIRFYATTTSALSWPDIENVVVSPESGAYAWAFEADGILNTTGGSQGIRSLNIHRSQFFGGGGAGTDAVRLRNVVNCHLSDVWTNGNVLIGGGGSSATNSNRVTMTGFEAVGGTLTIENCDAVSVTGTMNNVTINGTATNVFLSGDVNDLTIAAGATGTFVGRVRGTLTDNSGGTFGIYTQTGPRGATAYNGLIELGRATVNMNITTDQAITLRLPPGFSRYRHTLGFVVNNGSANLGSAVGGIYTSPSKSGAIVDASQTYSLITGANKLQQYTVNAAGLDLSTDLTLFFSLTTAAGVAGTAEIVLLGYVFT